MRQRVFVYGTLLSGEVNHGLLNGAELLGAWRTEPRFCMISLGAYPGVIAGENAIYGEVYGVDEATLAGLDRLEDYPRLYGRELIPTDWGAAWIYRFRGPVFDRRIIEGGDWRAATRPPRRDAGTAAGRSSIP